MKLLKLLIVFLVLCYSLPVNAEIQEWRDRDYPFPKQKRIFVQFNTPQNINEIAMHEVEDLLKEKMRPFITSLQKSGYILFEAYDIAERLKKTSNIDLQALLKTNPEESSKYTADFIRENADIGLSVDVLYYDTGSAYQEGHYNFITNYYNGTVTPYYISGENVPVSYACVQFTVTDVKSGKNVWIRRDNRSRANSDKISNTKPRDLMNRILKKYFSDAHKILTGKGFDSEE